MGIDIKTLRIGNHIICNGVRAKVVDLQTCRFAEKVFHIGVKGISPQTGEEKIVGATANSDYIQSIPITEELLTELGFEKIKDPQFDYAKRYENNRGLFVSIITADVVRIEAWDDVVHRGNMICKYLHELENFVFMTTKKELL